MAFELSDRVPPRAGDGAYGTALAAQLRTGESPDALNLREPRQVIGAHTDYLAAGARDIQTNTFLSFRASRARKRDLYRVGLDCAREAAATFDPDTVVWATIGPIGQAAADYYADIEILLDADATHVRCETVTNRECGVAFLDAWREVAVGVAATAMLTLSVVPARGIDSWRWIAELAAEAEAQLGLNCCDGLDGLREPLALLATIGNPVALLPSAGLPMLDSERVRYPWEPEPWAEQVMQLAEEFPVSLVGGCCGTTPAHIAALTALMAGG